MDAVYLLLVIVLWLLPVAMAIGCERLQETKA